MTKTNFVLKVLRTRGSISKLEAQHYNIGNVAECVRQLRNRGFDIETERKVDVEGRRYTRWVLKEAV